MAIPIPPPSLTSNQRQDSSSYLGDSSFRNIFGSVNTGGSKDNFLQLGIMVAIGIAGFYFFKKLR
ncbi:MAG: LPXTG cell wall anchor domain-containing protein [Alphaproteobacteria bacterium]|jgi:LPXTG-motif cell wall-anchored protein